MPPVQIGVATLIKDSVFRIEYEYAAWYDKVEVKAGVSSPIMAHLATNQNPDHPDGLALGAIVGVHDLWWARGEGVCVESLRTTAFAGNVHGVQKNEHVGEPMSAGFAHPYPHELAHILLGHLRDGVSPVALTFGVWRIPLDPAYECVQKPVYQWTGARYVPTRGVVTHVIRPRVASLTPTTTTTDGSATSR